MVNQVANFSVSEIDDQIKFHSEKVLELQKLRAKITGSKNCKIGKQPKVDKKSAENKYQLELAKREIENELMEKNLCIK